VRHGESQRSVARRLGVALRTVQRWLARAGEERLDRVDWADRSRAPQRTRRTAHRVEDEILVLREQLKEQSALGEYGAAAIRRELVARAEAAAAVPALRTIGRILERRGALDGRRRIRRPPPPPGWYLPDLAARRTELDCVDVIEGLSLRGGQQLDVLTAISLYGGLPAAWPERSVTTSVTLVALADHWRRHGLPAYAQFDNDVRFHGSHGYTDLFGRVVRLCLSLGVTPVFAPPYEMGFQAAIESFNGRWQAKVWGRRWSSSVAELQGHSTTYIAASRARSAARIEAAPARAPFPVGWEFDPAAPLAGRAVYLRRTTEQGRAQLLGHTFEVDRHWPHRLVRSELDLTSGRLRFYALRRREPSDQPLLRELPYEPVRPRRIYRLRSIGTVIESPPE
jgi:hypothetical protein